MHVCLIGASMVHSSVVAVSIDGNLLNRISIKELEQDSLGHEGNAGPCQSTGASF